MTILSSCLKDKRYVDFKDVGATIDFPAVAYNGGAFLDISLTASATPTTYPVLLNVSVPKALSSAVHITVKVDPAALTAYNASLPAGSTPYTLMSTSAYNIGSLTVTVPANQTAGKINVNFNTSAILATDILPLTIVSTDAGVISQWKTALYHVTVD